MANYFDVYKNRLDSHGGSIGQSFKNSTVQLINQRFKDSPLYTTINIDSISTEVRVVSEKLSNMKTLLFRPNTNKDKGSLVEYDGNYWLITDFDNNDMYPKAMIQKCNDVLKWRDESSVTHEFRCVLTNSTSLFTYGLEVGNIMTLANGEISVFVKYGDETKTVEEGQRFIFGSRVYKVQGIDDLTDMFVGKGILRVFVKLTTKTTSDDFINKIADNSTLYKTASSGGGITKW